MGTNYKETLFGVFWPDVKKKGVPLKIVFRVWVDRAFKVLKMTFPKKVSILFLIAAPSLGLTYNNFIRMIFIERLVKSFYSKKALIPNLLKKDNIIPK